MPLNLLPDELKLEIISNLESNIDKQCLRLTCSDFLYIIPKLPNPFNPKTYQYLPDNIDRLAFLARLTRPGDRYDTDQKLPCPICGFILLLRDFTGSLFTVDGYLVCNDCTLNKLNLSVKPGIRMEIGGRSFMECADCQLARFEDGLRSRPHISKGPHDDNGLICKYCYEDYEELMKNMRRRTMARETS